MVRAVIELLAGGRVYSGGDKSAWETGLTFEGIQWCIQDRRRSDWILWGPPGNRSAADTLAKKLTSASRILDGAILEFGREMVGQDQLALQNNYHRVKNMYEFFRNHVDTTLKRIDEFRRNRRLDIAEGLADFLNERFGLDKELEAYSLSAIMFFFAMTEVLLDCCFALGDRGGHTFMEYRKLDWGERFTRFFAVGTGQAQSIYEDVLRARREHRNIWAHADPVLYVPIEGVGLIPMTYDHLDKPSMNFFSTIDAGEAQRMFAAFDALLGLFEDHSLGWYAKNYADSGLPIQIAQPRADELRGLMNDKDAFMNELEERCRYQDAVDNMEI